MVVHKISRIQRRLGLVTLLLSSAAAGQSQTNGTPVPTPTTTAAPPAATTAPKATPAAPANTLPFIPELGDIHIEQILNKQEIHHWERHVRGFRREHNFALTAGVSSGTWSIRHFGTLNHQTYDNSGIYSKFQYAYHIQIVRGFGYLLGSSAGYHYETADSRAVFHPVAAYEFPGILAGLVYNFSPAIRVAMTGESYLERHNGIEEKNGPNDDTKISVTIPAYDAGVFIDVFYDLGWALRLEAHRRHLDYQAPNERTDEPPFPVNAAFSKDDRWLGLGLVYHLL